MKNLFKGFALVEVVIVIVLLSGSLLVFLEALSQAKSLQAKSEIITTQSILLHDKINELKSINYMDITEQNNYINFSNYPNYSFSFNVSYLNDNLDIVSLNTNMKRIDLNIKHNSSNYPLIRESFIISNMK
jgi:competence protein ComGF